MMRLSGWGDGVVIVIQGWCCHQRHTIACGWRLCHVVITVLLPLPLYFPMKLCILFIKKIEDYNRRLDDLPVRLLLAYYKLMYW